MHETMSTGFHFNYIDDILGAGGERFFSEGFKRVLHQIDDAKVETDENGKRYVRAKATILYPSDWSKKSEITELRPHLSTIDALIMSIQLNEIFLGHVYNMNDLQKQKMWLRRFVMKAGSTPQEDLTNFDIHTRHVETKIAPDTLYGNISTFESKIGTITVRCEIEHEIGKISFEDISIQNINKMLGESIRRYYGEGYKYSKQFIEDISIDIKHRNVDALVSVKKTDSKVLIDKGLEAFYNPSLSMIDCMTTIAQMAQALLYKLDNIDRSNSNTLWMRQVIIERKTPYQAYDPFIASTHITKSKLLKIKEKTWRSSELIGEFQDFELRYSLAHELPTENLKYL